jgi:hypothetical protein
LTGVSEHKEHQFALDPTLAWTAEHPDARFCDTRLVIPKKDYLKHPYIRWNESRFGSTHWLIGYTAPRDGLAFGVSLHAPASVGPLPERDAKLFRMLFEHMDAAIRLASRPPSFVSEEDATILLNRAGEVVRTSAAADDTIRSRTAFLNRLRSPATSQRSSTTSGAGSGHSGRSRGDN